MHTLLNPGRNNLRMGLWPEMTDDAAARLDSPDLPTSSPPDWPDPPDPPELPESTARPVPAWARVHGSHVDL
jgi:hypothetical protein